MNDAVHLADRACVVVTSADGGRAAIELLQNLVTCDVERLATGQSTFGALLTPQGKILFDFHVLRESDGVLLDVLATRRDALLQRLTFYRLRAPVELQADARSVWVGADVDGVADPRSCAIGRRAYLDDGEGEVDASNYHRRRIAAGVPELGHDFGPESVFPHEAMMDRLPGAGVAFDKGCYVGQEVVSRMQHRGTARSRFVPVRSGDAFPEMGTELTVEGRRVGTMGSSQGDEGLALLRLDKVAAGDRVSFEGGELTVGVSPLLDDPSGG